MRPTLSFALLLAVASVAHGTERRELSQEIEVKAGQTVRLEIPVAEIRIEAVDGPRMRADLTLECRWSRVDCRQALNQVEFEVRSKERRLRLELEGLPQWHKSNLAIEGTLEVPRSAPLEVDIGVGELEISGAEGDLWIDMGVGKVEAWLPQGAVGSVSLDVGVGEAELFGADARIEGRRSLLVGSEVYWDDGPGESRIRIDLGVGEINLRLE